MSCKLLAGAVAGFASGALAVYLYKSCSASAPAQSAKAKPAGKAKPRDAYPVAEASGVSKEEVLAVQASWAGAIKKISAVYKAGGDYIQAAADAAGELYAYGHYPVMFKPTKAAEFQFRPTATGAMSYFVGGKVTEGGCSEDGGFAINGGKGWAECVYENHQIELKDDVALAMGNYYFTCATTGSKAKVEYTFGYQRCDDGKVRIFLHHSSVPYNPH